MLEPKHEPVALYWGFINECAEWPDLQNYLSELNVPEYVLKSACLYKGMLTSLRLSKRAIKWYWSNTRCVM
jgi:hypothetical protein